MAEAAPVDTLFLDAGGVLVLPGWDRISAALAAEDVVISADALRAAEPFAKRDIDQPSIVDSADDRSPGWPYFHKVLEHAGVPLSNATAEALAKLRQYHQAENLWEELCPDVVPALAKFRELDLTVVVVSNSNGRLRHLLDRLDLTRWFDVVLDSQEWHVEKPDPRLFHIGLEQAGATADRTIHVGDIYHVDIVGARAAGLREGVLLDVAGLYPDVDCRRIGRLGDVVQIVK